MSSLESIGFVSKYFSFRPKKEYRRYWVCAISFSAFFSMGVLFFLNLNNQDFPFPSMLFKEIFRMLKNRSGDSLGVAFLGGGGRKLNY